MTKMPEETPTKVATAIKVVADEMGCSTDDVALIVKSCNDRIEGECVAVRIARYEQAGYSGWVAINLKGGSPTELRVNPEVRGGIVALPESRNPLRKYLKRYYLRKKDSDS